MVSTFKVIKYKSESCGLCYRMSHYDAKTSDIMGYEFEVVDVDDPGEKRGLIKHLIKFTPNKKDIAFPTYVILKDGEFCEGWKGAVPKTVFKNRLETIYSKHGQRSFFSSEVFEGGANPG